MIKEYLDKYDEEFNWTLLVDEERFLIYIEEDEVSLAGHWFAQAGEVFKLITVTLDFEYSESYKVGFDAEINQVLLYGISKYNIEHMLIDSNPQGIMPSRIKKIFNSIDTLNSLSLFIFFSQEEYRYLEDIDINTLRIKMINLRDINFPKLIHLKKCYVVLDRQYSTNDDIKESKKYLNELKISMSKLDIQLRID